MFVGLLTQTTLVHAQTPLSTMFLFSGLPAQDLGLPDPQIFQRKAEPHPAFVNVGAAAFDGTYATAFGTKQVAGVQNTAYIGATVLAGSRSVIISFHNGFVGFPGSAEACRYAWGYLNVQSIGYGWW